MHSPPATAPSRPGRRCPPPLTATFGRFVKIELFYPRLRDAMFEVLKCAPTQRAVEAAIMQWDGEALELAIGEECGAIGMVRTADE